MIRSLCFLCLCLLSLGGCDGDENSETLPGEVAPGKDQEVARAAPGTAMRAAPTTQSSSPSSDANTQAVTPEKTDSDRRPSPSPMPQDQEGEDKEGQDGQGQKITFQLMAAETLRPLRSSLEKACQRSGGCKLSFHAPTVLMAVMRQTERQGSPAQTQAESQQTGIQAEFGVLQPGMPHILAVDHFAWRDLAFSGPGTGERRPETFLPPPQTGFALSPLRLAAPRAYKKDLLARAAQPVAAGDVLTNEERGGDEAAAPTALSLRALPLLAKQGVLTSLQGVPGREASALEAYLALLAALPEKRQAPKANSLRHLAIQENLKLWFQAVLWPADRSQRLQAIALRQAEKHDPRAVLGSLASLQQLNKARKAQGQDPLDVIETTPGLGRLELTLQGLSQEKADLAVLDRFAQALKTVLAADLPHSNTGDTQDTEDQTGWFLPRQTAEPGDFDLSEATSPGTNMVFAAAPRPERDVLYQAVQLYRETFRKPVFLSLCMDPKALQQSPQGRDVLWALGEYFDPLKARQGYRQSGPKDRLWVLTPDLAEETTPPEPQNETQDTEAVPLPEVMGSPQIRLYSGPDAISAFAGQSLSGLTTAQETLQTPTAPDATDFAQACLQEAARRHAHLPEREGRLGAVLWIHHDGDLKDLKQLDRYYRLTQIHLPIYSLTLGTELLDSQKTLAFMTEGEALALSAGMTARAQLARLLGWY